MRHEFNLVVEPWIPCVTAAGQSQELGLLEVLLRAPEIAEIHDPSPTVTASIYRLLLAILHRNFGPKNRHEWEVMWDCGRWDEGILRTYFGRWHQRFDLFDPERPFYQCPRLPHSATTVAVLAPEMAHGNNPTLFDHARDDRPFPVPPAAAARLVVATQAFQVGGLISRVKGEPPSAPAAPLTGGVVVLFQGDNLFRTLMLNLLPYDGYDQPWPGQKHDCPVWERDEVDYGIRPPHGYLDYLTWQSRRIWLKPECRGGSTVVREAVIASGRRFPEGYFPPEPQFSYRRNRSKNPRPGEPAWLPLRFGLGRALWRDSTALLAAGSEEERPPRARDWLAELIAAGKLERATRYRVAAFGLCGDRAKIHFWRREWMPVPAAYLADREVMRALRDALDLCEKGVGFALRSALQAMASKMVEVGSPRRRERGDEAIVVVGEARYWASLELPFYRLLEDLPVHSNAAMRQWAQAVTKAALEAFDHAVGTLDASVRFLKHAVRIRADLEWRLRRYRKPYEEVMGG